MIVGRKILGYTIGFDWIPDGSESEADKQLIKRVEMEEATATEREYEQENWTGDLNAMFIIGCAVIVFIVGMTGVM